MAGNGGNGLFVDIVNAVAFAFELQFFGELLPQSAGTIGGTGQKLRAAVVRSIIFNDKVADIDVLAPIALMKVQDRIPFFRYCFKYVLLIYCRLRGISIRESQISSGREYEKKAVSGRRNSL